VSLIRRRYTGTFTFTVTEDLDVERHVKGKPFVVGPTVVWPADDRGIWVASMFFNHAEISSCCMA
jgi:hypothetical protein